MAVSNQNGLSAYPVFQTTARTVVYYDSNRIRLV